MRLGLSILLSFSLGQGLTSAPTFSFRKLNLEKGVEAMDSFAY